jgi:hypothetical protein
MHILGFDLQSFDNFYENGKYLFHPNHISNA